MILEIKEPQLIAGYLKGDEKCLEILIQKYLKPIYVFSYRYVGNQRDAEDITQSVFIRVWKNLKKFDQQKSFKTWIFTIAKNACIDFLRKKKIKLFSEFEDEKGENKIIENIPDSEILPNEIFEKFDAAQEINLMVEKLPPNYSIILSLYYNDNFTLQEVSEILGESVNTVKSRHRRALIKLRELFLAQ